MRIPLALILASAVLAAACTTGKVAGSTPTPTPAVTPASTPTATATPTPTAAATPTPQPSGPGAALSCSLPVASGDAPIDGKPGDGARGRGGFVKFPSAAFTADPQSLGAYVRGAGKWVPVRRDAVSPDGRSYAYPEYRTASGPATGIIHVVDVAGGSDRQINVPAPSIPVAFEKEGIYVARVVPDSGAPAQGLSLVDPSSGALKQVTADARSWLHEGAGAAWAVDSSTGSGDPSGGDRVSRLDVGSGAITVWYTAPGLHLRILGLDSSGNPVLANSTPAAVEIRTNKTTVVYSAAPNDQSQPVEPVVADSTGLWLGSYTGDLYHLGSSGRLEKFAATGVQLALPAGGCA